MASMFGTEPQVPGDWRWDAACFRQRMWYDTFGAAARPITRADAAMQAAALNTCRTCPVLEDCETWSLTDPEPAVDMVAGGFTPRRRREIREARNA